MLSIQYVKNIATVHDLIHLNIYRVCAYTYWVQTHWANLRLAFLKTKMSASNVIHIFIHVSMLSIELFQRICSQTFTNYWKSPKCCNVI